MDREIPKEVRQKERKKKIIRYAVAGVAVVVMICVLVSLMRTTVREGDLEFSTVVRGTFDVSVSE